MLFNYKFEDTDVPTPTTQKQYQLVKQSGGAFALKLLDAPVRAPADHEVRVRMKAASLNRRDIMVSKGQYPMGTRDSLVPLSDGAGEVESIGAKVTRFKKGDHVAPIFFQSWLAGRPDEAVGASALGGSIDGVLSQYVTLNEQGLVRLPAGYSFEEGATLPCAAVTAWNGLVTRGRMRSGDFVLLQGSGGVSIFGLQFAKAALARPVITSSSDQKLERARGLGAVGTANYKTTPDWEKPVRAATGGVGVHHVLEVGGAGTLEKSLASLAPGGHIALIGGLAGFGGSIAVLELLVRNISVSGIFVGSRANFEAMTAFIEQHHIRPVIDRVFEFGDAAAAFDYMDTGKPLRQSGHPGLMRAPLLAPTTVEPPRYRA